MDIQDKRIKHSWVLFVLTIFVLLGFYEGAKLFGMDGSLWDILVQLNDMFS